MSRQTLSSKRKANDTQCASKRQNTQQRPQQQPLALPEPSFIIKLKNEYVEPEHEDFVRLTLSTGSTYPSPPERPRPPPPPPESPPHPSLLQFMPSTSSSSSSRSLQPPPELPSFSQLLAQFPSPPGFPVLPSSQPLPGNGILNLPPPTKPPLGFLFQPELPTTRQQSPPFEQKQRPPAKQKQETQAEQKQKPTSEPKQEPQAEGQASNRRPRNYKKPGWTATIEPPYPWASSTRAKVLSMEELLSQNITKVRGDLNCKECKKQFQIEYDLRAKFSEVVSFITENLEDMHDRAPQVWLKPEDLDCEYCRNSKCVEPLLPEHKKETNWLFLFLGQLIGHCSLTHLKHFCKHARLHRTAAKDRLVYLAYTTLHLQLDPKAAKLYEKD